MSQPHYFSKVLTICLGMMQIGSGLDTSPIPELPDELDKLSFFEYCRDGTPPAAYYTVRIILRSLQEDDCGLASDRMKSMTQLVLPREGLQDLRPLQDWTAMTGLELTDNEIADAAPLGGLNNLQTLLLDRNRIGDLSFVTQLPALTKLHIANNRLRNIDPLSVQKSVKDLKLSENTGIQDLSPLAELSLRSLYLHAVPLGNQIDRLLPQAKLTMLDLSNSGLTSATPLGSNANLPVIRKLLLGGNRLIKIDPLANLKTIVVLDISDNPVEDLAALASLDQLVALNVSNVKARNFPETVSSLTLTELYAQGLELQNLDWIDSMSDAARTLDLSNNNIGDITKLYRFQNLRHLNLTNNPIEEIDTDWLSSLKNLQVFKINIQTIRSLETRKRLLAIKAIAFERSRSQ